MKPRKMFSSFDGPTATAQPILAGKRILVTGGTGSMGKVLVRRLLSNELGTPAKVIVLSRDEAKQHDMRMSYLHRKVSTDEVIYRNFLNSLEFRLGDVRRFQDVCSAMQNVDVVINAAALKQVPNCEYFPEQAIETNCMGPINIVRCIREHQLPVETVVGISTDKACKPVNVMGLTKAIHERIFTSANILSPKTRFICTRYGNVLASRGSVILVVDDERALLDVVGAFIEEFGDIPLLANNVAEAKRTFEAHPDIACALLDLTMPSGGGAVLARAFKELRPAVPIVLMSGFAQTDVTESLRGLLDAVIAKPFAPGDLQKVLARALGR